MSTKPKAAQKTAPKAQTPEPQVPAGTEDKAPETEPDTSEKVPAPLFRVEQAQALPEVDGEPLETVAEGIQSFKDTDRRTMNVVCVAGVLFKQAV